MSQVPNAPLLVAAAQAPAEPGDVAGNAKVAASLVAEAAGEGAAVAVLPELFLPGYHPPALAELGCDVQADVSGAVDDPRLDPVRAAVAEHGVVTVVSAAVRRPDGSRRLSALVVDRAGGVRAVYDKRYLCGPDEKALFTPGDRDASLLVDGWHLALGICYDGCFPEHARAAALAGAHAYLCPAAYLAGSQHRRDVYYAARALDNSFYVVFADAVDGPEPWRLCGGSAIYEPEGRALVQAPDTGRAVVVAELEPAAIATTRREHEMLADLRTDTALDTDQSPRKLIEVA